MNITEMRVNQVEKPLGFVMNYVSFSWVLTDEEVYSELNTIVRVYEKDKKIYDSGLCKEINNLDYEVELQLKPRTRYVWEVTVLNHDAVVSKNSSWFESGKMNEKWSGKWISPEKSTDSVILYKRFTIDELTDSRLYICGLGVYECYINGRKVSNEYLAPGYHSYDLHLQSQTYDVTDYLCIGENELEIWLGEGWFKGRLGFDGGYENIYGDHLYAIAEIYAGHKLILKTDEEFLVKKSPIIFNNIYDGEVIDLDTKKDQQDEKVILRQPVQCGPLYDRYSLPIVEKMRIPVKEVLHTKKNESVLDFKQIITGWIEMNIYIPKGKVITLYAGEILQDDCFYRDNYRTAKAYFKYISDGHRHIIRPHFTFYGFRYIKVECDYDISNIEFTAVHLRSDFDQIGHIETGNKKVNQLISNTLWGQMDNFLDVPSDCPQRDERLGWTGDAQIFSDTACYNMYVPAFFRKYLWDMRAEQDLLDGAVPNVVPRLKHGMVSEFASCPWADAAVVIPWNTYRHYGSKTLLKECYPGMKAWVDYQKHNETKEKPYLVSTGFHFADWLALDNVEPGPFGATDPYYIASAYYYYCADVISKTAQILQYNEVNEYEELAAHILSVIREEYFTEDGICKINTQTAKAIAIAFGLTKNESEEGRQLAQLVKKKGHLDTGFVGTRFLCQALSQTGYHHLSVDLLLREEYPGWLYEVNHGATTIWERWNSVMDDGSMNPEGMNSLNHYAYGSIVGWMYAYACGIVPLEPGFKKCRIAPIPDYRLGFMKCSLNTPTGRLECDWNYTDDGTLCYNIYIPYGMEAEIIIPGKEKMIVKEGHYHF